MIKARADVRGERRSPRKFVAHSARVNRSSPLHTLATRCCCPVFAIANVNSTAKIRTWPGVRWTRNVFFFAALFFGTSFFLLLRYELEESYFSTLYNTKVKSTFRIALENVLKLLNLAALLTYAVLCYAIARDRVAFRRKFRIPGRWVAG